MFFNKSSTFKNSSISNSYICLNKCFPQSRIFSELDLHVFGCSAFVLNLSPFRSKLDPRSFRCVFLGYFFTQKGYRCYCPILKKYFMSHDVKFFEHLSFFFSKNPLQGGSFVEYNFLENNSSRDNFCRDNLSGDHSSRDSFCRDNFC